MCKRKFDENKQIYLFINKRRRFLIKYMAILGKVSNIIRNSLLVNLYKCLKAEKNKPERRLSLKYLKIKRVLKRSFWKVRVLF